MRYTHVIADWNGTILRYTTDEQQNRTIAYAVLDDVKQALRHGKIWRAPDLVGLFWTKRKLNRRVAEFYEGKRPLATVYEPFNSGVISGRPVELIAGAIRAYAKENRDQLHTPTLDAIAAARGQGADTGILSVSLRESIEAFLQDTPYQELFFSDDIVANRLVHEHGQARRVTLNIYDEKGTVFEEEFLRDRSFPAARTAYLGDAKDDEPVADLLPRGNFVVSLLADDDFKQQMASRYGATVPENESDLQRKLLEA